MLLDTSIFIDFIREYQPAVDAFDQLLHSQSASVITKLELIIGFATKKDIPSLDKIFKKLGTDVIPINSEISIQAEKILRKYYHSNGIGILDALIAATALVSGEELATRNVKHFNFIPDLKVFKPY